MKKIDKRRKVIDECQISLWKTKKELESFSVLLGGFHSGNEDNGVFYGSGLTIKRLSNRLNKVSEKLSEIY